MAPLLGWVAPAAGAIAGELALRFQDYRRVRGVQTYEDQVATTRALLERPDTLETVRREGWRVILDEAQDTDEAQFSVLVTESVPPHAVGTALTLQTSLGFLLTAVVIQLVPPLAARFGWPWAFAVLSLGPVFGMWSIRQLVRNTAGHR